MRLTEQALMLVAAWSVVLTLALVATIAALGDLRRLGRVSKVGSWVWASSTIPGCLLFVEFTGRYAIGDGAIRIPGDLRTIAVAFFGTIAGLCCVVVGVALRKENASPRVAIARVGWTLAWAMSGLVSFSMAASA